MNDFTKLELMHIGDSLFYSMAIFPSRKDSLMTIRGKILEMIDNYPTLECDHRSNGNCYINGKITSLPTQEYKCRYCDKYYKCIFKNGSCIGYEECGDPKNE